MLKKFQLKNGLKVLLFESHKSPVVSIQSWVRTGSADEKKGEEGISHFIEHLLFKSTRKFKVGEIAAFIEGSGGELNAYTSFDQTVFYITISKQFSDLGLEAISEMMGYPKFDAEEINPEREVVVEEIKRGNDSPGQKASKLLFSTAYAKHPYRLPVIGYEKNVRSWSAKKLKQYYQSRYSPKNMFLVIAGDFDSSEIKKKIQNHFGPIESHKIRKSLRIKEPVQKKSKVEVEEAAFEQSLLYISWKTPTVKHDDIPALDVLALTLGQGDSSRLVKKLRIEKAVVNSIGSSVFSAQDQGLFVVSMGYNKENLDEAMTGIMESIKNIIQEKITDEEIKKSITNLECEQFYSSETVDGLARQIGNSEFLMNRPDYLKKYISQIRKVNEKELKRVAKKYLIPATMTITCMTNDKRVPVKSALQKWTKDYANQFLKWKSAPTSKANLKLGKSWPTRLGSKKSDLKILQLTNGVRVLIRKSEDTHTVCAKAAFLGGVRAEDPKLEGVVELLGRSWTGGTENLSESDIYKTIESLGSSLSPVCGRNSIGLSLESLVPFEGKAADLFLEVLTRPLFPTEVVEREKLVQIEQIKARNDKPSQLCIREFMRLLFHNHPNGKDVLGSEETLKHTGSREVQSLWKTLAQQKNLTLMISGNINEDLWLKKLEKGLSHFTKGEKFNKHWPVQELKKDEFIFTELKKEQSHLVYGFHGLTMMDQEKYALHVLQSILAGMGGRLFIELREKNSLAYSVSPLSQEGIERGYFGAYIGCSPEKVPKALEMMKQEFKKLCDHKISDLELARAKRYLAGRHDIDLQRTSALANSILYDDIYGIDPLETFKAAEHYFAVTSEQVMAVAQKLFKQKTITSLVGPNNPLL